ncbi:sigma-54-dependent transcriptional regulator [Azospirillum halopraeferens]|uniref:sigma-54-dependent transcriptional regulator n=1 Tax=Azospirillum halopraeferens TaxID=34010 RepID=UPI000407A9F1|nr:sigma-54 dependent transcriptional regulator [Azospirillum halopraeferens]
MSRSPTLPVLFVDDEEDVRHAGEQTLTLAGHPVMLAASGEEALALATREMPGAVVTDVRMPGIDGLELMARLRALDPDLPVIVVTGHGDVPMAVRAMREGALDFIEKPHASDRLVEAVDRALEIRALALDSRARRAELERHRAMGTLLVGRTPAMQRLRATLHRLGAIDADILVLGETGTGKELVARTLHEGGPRRACAFVALNCGALPEAIAESELFGHEAGAFTSANKRRVGRIEHADGGTLFLDEIESMPPSLQVKLLRVLQERVVEPVGSNRAVPVDIRVVAATKVDLRQLAAEGRFREDLYHRLNVVPLRIPPLRERPDDIPLLFEHFVSEAVDRYRCEAPPLSADLHRRLMSHPWTGNVRELRHVAERYVLGLDDPIHAAAATDGAPEPAATLAAQVDRFEKGVIERELARRNGNVTATLQALGIPRKSFYDKARRLAIDLDAFR